MSVDVAIMMGSANDWDVMRHAAKTLSEFDVTHEARVLSAHRTPAEVLQFVQACDERGTRVFIAAAGLAAHLAGAVAAHTVRPVLGVPLSASDLGGLDADPAVELVLEPPTRMIPALREGSLDAALLSSVEAIRHPGYSVAAGIGIACKHEIRSVRAFRRHARIPSQGGALPGSLPGIGWSDHWSFWQEGIPGIMVTDTAPFRYPAYHLPGDTPDRIDYLRTARGFRASPPCSGTSPRRAVGRDILLFLKALAGIRIIEAGGGAHPPAVRLLREN